MNIIDLDISVFRFDHRTDYLPYFRRFLYELESGSDITLYELLNLIKESDTTFDYADESGEIMLKIEDVTILGDCLLSSIAEEFGDTFAINPISRSCAKKDLIVEKSEYLKKLDIFDSFIDSEDEVLFASYLKYNFISENCEIDRDYIGEGVFLFAADMCEKYPEHSIKILESISKSEDGVLLYPGSYNKLFPANSFVDERIDTLKRRIYSGYPTQDEEINRVRGEHFKSFGFDSKSEYLLKGSR